ncbi:MAG: glycosyltransferase, partial [Symploca sp. SIO2D2]|nr:glycosyltransferase [Symploca sp. SIO2D2]
MIISVIIPTYKRHGDLIKCLDCLAPSKQIGMTHISAQASEEAVRYEIVVSDDGDASETIDLIGHRSEWARIVQGPRKGPAANRNNAVAHSEGEWLAFTDDDCLPDTQWLQSFLQAIREDTVVLEGKTITDEPYIGIFSQAPLNLEGGKLWSCNMLFKRTFFDEIGRFDEAFPYPHMEDVDLRDRVLQSGHEFDFI